MGTRSAKIYLLLILSLIYSPVHAQEWVESYTNTRALGMGGALIGVTSDETSLFRNPANLGSIRNYFGVFIDPELEGQSDFTKLINASKLSKALDIETVTGILKSNPDHLYHARLQFTPTFTVRNFGLGLIYRNELNATYSAVSATVNTFYQNDLGAVVGYNESFFGGVLKVGGSAKAFNRIEVINPALDANGPFDLSSIASEGSAMAYDGALMIQMPVDMIPTLSAVVHDIGDTKFDKKDGVRARAATQPQDIKQTIDTAISIFPIHGDRIRSTWTIEYRDVSNSKDDDDQLKHFHFGTEFNIRDILFLRAGVNQRYYTAGVEFSTERLTWQLSTYGEEVGTNSAHKEDRRYSTRFMVRF